MEKPATLLSIGNSPKVPEILAPAGGRAQFFAALNSGADAVYLGLKAFNARARAENFTIEDLRELLPMAHDYGMKVLVTVNVLVKETELPSLVDTLSALEELQVHAIIVQDLAVASLAKRHFPGLRLHASTQLAVHNLAGVIEAWRFGFKRVVLARELTGKEIEQIRKAVPENEIELEAFCHGSLCYSYSGLCFFSGASDARSGNRGECAYTCRQPYKILNEPGHGFLFSMRDLDSSQVLEALVRTGVDTLKIEGRKKDAQYVSTVVKLYRQKLDAIFGRDTLREKAPESARRPTQGESLRQDLSLSFHRKVTSFFLKGRYFENVIDLDNPTHLGLRVGEIKRVNRGSIELSTEIAIERFDGLKVVASAQVFHAKPQHGEKNGSTEGMHQRWANEIVEFPLRDMRSEGAWIASVPSARWVEILWPEGKPLPRVGDVLFKTRSADLKRRVHKLESPPPDARIRPLSLVDLNLKFQEEGSDLILGARLSKLGVALTDAEIRIEKQGTHGESRFLDDVTSTLGLFGDSAMQVDVLQVEGGAQDWFVPRSKIKELKKKLSSGLVDCYREIVEQRRLSAHAGLSSFSRPPSLEEGAKFHVKLDRLETLSSLAEFLEANPKFPISEVMFEPKRAFLPSANPEVLLNPLLEFSERFQVPIRFAIPTVLRAWDEPTLKRWLTASIERGLSRFEVGNVGALELLRTWGMTIIGLDLASDFSLYALNSEATKNWARRGLQWVCLSIEDDRQNLASHLARWPWEENVRPLAILFKDTPLFIAEACSLTALHNGCPTAKVCGYRTLEIENPSGEKFFVAHESCKSIVYAEEAYSITHRRDVLFDLGVRNFRIDFLTRPYAKDRMFDVLNAAWIGERIVGTHCANFDRTLL